MKSGPLYSAVFAAAAAIWAALYAEVLAPLSPPMQQVVAALPCCALMWFGCWSLGTISYNLIKLKECPEAASSLAAEVLAARADLLRKGLDVDAPPPDR